MADWKYYNHALVPTCAPHEEPNLEEMNKPDFWKKYGGHPLFARWTTDWDCGYETEWWYVIKDGEFSLDTLSKSSRKSINKALKNIEVRVINPKEYVDQLWKTYKEAILKYKNVDNYIEEEKFKNNCINYSQDQEYWGAFLKDTNSLVGYIICIIYDEYVNMSVSKYSALYLKYRVSDALNFVVIDYYINHKNKKYILNGTRAIKHETNVQDYYEEHFNFRKAYCKLHIKYKPIMYLAIKILFPFKFIIKKFNFKITREISSVLKMEELAKKCKGKMKNE